MDGEAQGIHPAALGLPAEPNRGRQMEPQQVRAAIKPPTNMMPYLMAVVLMAVFTLAAIVVIAIARPDKDNAALYASIIGFATTTTAAIMTFMKAQETHLSVNSRLDQFIQNADLKARAEGEIVGLLAGRKSADHRTDTLKAARDSRVDVLADIPTPVVPGSPAADPAKEKAHLEIAATIVNPVGEKPRVEDIAATIRPEAPKK